jgi:hypothetical protein
MACAAVLAGSSMAGPASGQQILSQFFGSGVHNFYERDYFEAMRELNAAADGGSGDPRVYYYRGLTHMRLGNSAAAARDLRKGAELERADVDGFYPVGKSLERVQGSERLMLERYRALARAEARQRQVARDAARYEQLRRAETQVLRSVPLGPPPAPLMPPRVAPVTALEPIPPVTGKEKPGPAGTEPAEETPFDKVPAADKPAEPSPFADEPAADKPTEEMPIEEKPAAKPPAAEVPKAEPAKKADESENPFGPE